MKSAVLPNRHYITHNLPPVKFKSFSILIILLVTMANNWSKDERGNVLDYENYNYRQKLPLDTLNKRNIAGLIHIGVSMLKGEYYISMYRAAHLIETFLIFL